MSKKNTENYECTVCFTKYLKNQGKCFNCGTFGSIEEIKEVNEVYTGSNKNLLNNSGESYKLYEISGDTSDRYFSGYNELDRVLGGGIVKGSIILFTGDPGVGKSTLIGQVSGKFSNIGKVLYVTGEESPQQIKGRMIRIGIEESNENLEILAEINIEVILNKIEELKPNLLIIDSIQTLVNPEITGVAGGVSQIRSCSEILRQVVKNLEISTFVIGHVTKNNELAGPKMLEHMVDVVMHFEGDKQQQIRLIRCEKNRFGSTEEIGVFEMKEEGLVEVSNLAEFFITDTVEAAGSCITVIMEGTRPILAEVQALVVPSRFNFPQIVANGADKNRVVMLSSVLDRKLGISLEDYDIYINVVGGLKVKDTSIDMAIVSSILSSLKDEVIPNSTVIIGEVGLTGEIRRVNFLEKRIKECLSLKRDNLLVPIGTYPENITGKVTPISSLTDLFNKIFNESI